MLARTDQAKTERSDVLSQSDIQRIAL